MPPPAASPGRGRGGTGRRAGFRFQYRKMWGFESLRPHQVPAGGTGRRRFFVKAKLREMQIVETTNEGLKRAYSLTIPAKDIEARIDREVKKIAPQVRMPGFRPGKVPANLEKMMHGPSLMQEALNSSIQEGIQQLIDAQKIRP